jgi:transcriptional regulator with XRE-family HTH domain
MNDDFARSWPGRQLLITQRLRQRRADLGLTQKQVVTRLARIGVITTNRALSSLEHGAGIDVAKLPELAAALDCTVTYLVGLTDEPHRWEPDLGSAPLTFAPERRPAPPPATPATPATPSAPSRASRRPGDAPESLIIGAGVPDRSPRAW